jgi:basic membrane protein A
MSNTISANLIGTNASGTAAIGNRRCGLLVFDASYNIIGGSIPQQRNVISGNEGGQPDPDCGAGLDLNGASHNRVIGNYVGTDFSGSEPIGNLVAGIQFGNGSAHNLIKDNVASANALEGIKSWGEGNTNNTITGNLIGLDASGDVPMGNGEEGLSVIGGDHSEVISNVVADNHLMGVMVWASHDVTVRGNTVYSNTAEWGGGIGVGESERADLHSNVVYSNTATWGGGVYLYRSPTATLQANDVYGNVADKDGGGMIVEESPGAVVSQNTIRANRASVEGGGLYLADSAVPEVTNNIVADNAVGPDGQGSGVCVLWDTDAELAHNTIARNRGGDGSGVRVWLTSTAKLTNTILVSHTVGITVGHGCTATLDHTLWGSGTPWANATHWVNHGTLTHTDDLGGHPRFLDPDAGDYHLGLGSAAAEAATATHVTTDIDGEDRPIGALPDLGADEGWKYVALPLALKTHSASQEPSPVVSAAFVYQGAPGGLGWSAEHERGRQHLERELGSGVVTTYTHDLTGNGEAEIRQLAGSGWDMVFATSFGLGEAVQAVAPDFPDILFEHCAGAETGANLATYFGRMYQPRYLSGIVAGAMTESDIVGYVAPFELIPEVVRGIDAFALGVRAVNPDAEVYVAWTGSWYDPTAEREAAEELLDAGADVLAQHQDTLEPQLAAKERGALSIGYQSDMRPSVGNSVLTSPTWDWGAYYVDTVQAAQDTTWTTHDYWGGLADGVVTLAEFSPLVPQAVRDQVESEGQAITETDWDVFCGPIDGQDGTERVPAGECLTDEELKSLDWFVEGVVSEMP